MTQNKFLSNKEKAKVVYDISFQEGGQMYVRIIALG